MKKLILAMLVITACSTPQYITDDVYAPPPPPVIQYEFLYLPYQWSPYYPYFWYQPRYNHHKHRNYYYGPRTPQHKNVPTYVRPQHKNVRINVNPGNKPNSRQAQPSKSTYYPPQYRQAINQYQRSVMAPTPRQPRQRSTPAQTRTCAPNRK